jgi:predicted NBD/HSP70 family sugar kinase
MTGVMNHKTTAQEAQFLTTAPKPGGLSGASGDARSAGRLLVLNTIRRAGQIARIDISKQTGFSPATVTAITADLLAAGAIEPMSPDDVTIGAKRGRPREALKLRGAFKLIAGLNVAARGITVLLTDFEGYQVGEYDYPLPAIRSRAEDLAEHILAAVRGACVHNARNFDEISGIGIGLAGQVDGKRGFVHWSSSLTERNVDLGAILAARAPFPVFIENDANLVTKAEQLFGEGRYFENFVVVTIEHGIGMGIVIGGKLYRGSRGCGAEFGHVKVNADGALCQCGQRGCLEAYAGEYALLRAANEAGATHYASIAALGQAEDAGDPVAQAVFDQARQVFAMGLANLVNIFDPERLIIASRNTSAHPLCAPSMLAAVAELVMQVDTPMPEIRVHGWGDLMWAKGAAAFGIEQISELCVNEMGK